MDNNRGRGQAWSDVRSDIGNAIWEKGLITTLEHATYLHPF
jgi:hypothetical protein